MSSEALPVVAMTAERHSNVAFNFIRRAEMNHATRISVAHRLYPIKVLSTARGASESRVSTPELSPGQLRSLRASAGSGRGRGLVPGLCVLPEKIGPCRAAPSSHA